MQGTTETRKAINDAMLEGLIKLHSHSVYSSHAEASETIKELASDPEVRPILIQYIGAILKMPSSSENLLSTALLVVDDLASSPDEEAIACCIEMRKSGVQNQVEAMARSVELLLFHSHEPGY